jgi:hypothetical protein
MTTASVHVGNGLWRPVSAGGPGTIARRIDGQLEPVWHSHQRAALWQDTVAGTVGRSHLPRCGDWLQGVFGG